MADIGTLIEKHRSKGVLLDTNLLVLFLVGQIDRRQISVFKRTRNFSVEDFHLLGRLVGTFGTLITTPHVLAQVSDLTDLPGKDFVKNQATVQIGRRGN